MNAEQARCPLTFSYRAYGLAGARMVEKQGQGSHEDQSHEHYLHLQRRDGDPFDAPDVRLYGVGRESNGMGAEQTKGCTFEDDRHGDAGDET